MIYVCSIGGAGGDSIVVAMLMYLVLMIHNSISIIVCDIDGDSGGNLVMVVYIDIIVGVFIYYIVMIVPQYFFSEKNGMFELPYT